MAQHSQGQKSKWGVGAFFQSAVGGLESRLDNLLLDEEERQKTTSPKPAPNGSTGPSVSRSPAGCTNYLMKIVRQVD